ncbi:hypothetical protein CVD28_03770 [Bacillus sp. M6-12]|uniref:EAL domain-containing protein n=1 Tax=Bacillus sp. M6-12 TaxID=2054166 RepID=UPI000C7866F5|nr:EAL domain-containing protein [Bacillus sp. M6-12]PLS19545.1 hypothetical protein CVD28_03770 [Bacillus sp. M6-12]
MENPTSELKLYKDILKALDNEEFQLHYQPKVNLVSGRIMGVEALIRWNKPEAGWISPLEFIPYAEKSGIIVSIGEWVLRTACKQIKVWQSNGLPNFPVAVNLSVRQLYQPNLVKVIEGILLETNLSAECLELEITESMIADTDYVLPIIKELKNKGIKFHLDDFGTGYSSLRHLKEFPIDMIKIDQSFIRNCTGDIKDATIVKTIIGMAQQLKMKVIAEGVETKEQLIFLQENLCNQVQGYLFSKPIRAEVFEQDFYDIEKIMKAVGIPQELSREKWLERELENTRQELLDTIRQQQGMIFKYIKKDGKYIHTLCNGELLYRMGLTPESVIGKELFDFLPYEEALNKFYHYDRAWNGEKYVTYEGIINGIFYLAKLRYIKRGGEIVEVIGSAVDITDRKKIEEEVRESENQHRLMVELSPEATIVHRKGIIKYANPASVELLGASSIEDLIGKPILDFSTPEYIELVEERIRKLDEPGLKIVPTEEKVIRMDGKVIDVEVTGISMNYNGKPSYLMIIHDLTKSKQAQKALQESEERYRLIAENMSDLVCLIDKDGIFKYASPSHVSILGYPSTAYEGNSVAKWVYKEDIFMVKKIMEDMKLTKREKIFEFSFKDINNEWVWLEAKATPIFDEKEKFVHYLFISREITERKMYEQKLTYLAYHDTLTGVPNRRLFNEILEQKIHEAESHDRILAIFFMDLDNFKKINDSYGHDIGDKLLKEFANRIKNCIREDDILSRQGGDEFVVLLPNLHSQEDAINIANRILECFQTPFHVEDYVFPVTSSIGISFYPINGTTRRALIKSADIALYQAKENGRNNYKIFGEE